MRIYTLLSLVVLIITYGVYFYSVEPLIDHVWQRFLIFILIFIVLNFLGRKLESHVKFLNKRMGKHLSVWIVIGLFSAIFIIGMS